MGIKTHLYNSQYKIREWMIGNYFRRFQFDSSISIPPDFQPKKVLFVLNGLLGDSVMSVPAIVKARELWNDAHFALLGRSHNCELLSACPSINEFYENNTDPFSLRKSKDVRRLQE